MDEATDDETARHPLEQAPHAPRASMPKDPHPTGVAGDPVRELGRSARRAVRAPSGLAAGRIQAIRSMDAEALRRGHVVGPAIAHAVRPRPETRVQAGVVTLVLLALCAVIVWFLRMTWVLFLESGTAGRIVTGTLGIATTGALVLFLISLLAHVLPVLVGGGGSRRSDMP